MKKNDITGLGCPVSSRAKKNSPKGFMEGLGSMITGDTGPKMQEGEQGPAAPKNWGQTYNTLQKEGLDVGKGIKIGGASQVKAAQTAQNSIPKPSLSSGPPKTLGEGNLSLGSLKGTSKRIKLGGA